jgi:glutamyl-tRNA reductase
MNLRAVGCNVRTAAVEWRERLAFTPETQAKAAADLAARYGEAVVLSTCNRVELYVAGPPDGEAFDAPAAASFLAAAHGVPVEQVRPLLYAHAGPAAVAHLCRVTASLDSLIVGEGQIAGQVRQAFDLARTLGTTGPLLNALFPHAVRTAKRVRTETGISHGHASVSSVAVDYVRQVFDHFADKTVLVIGAGKMGRLTLKHLAHLNPGRILVTNRSPERAAEVAAGCGGRAVPWDKLDDALAEADIALSTTGAQEMVMPLARFEAKVRPRRRGGPLVVLDIAVPRDFDPAIHDGDRVCVFNIDDLARVRERTLAERRGHVAAAEGIVAAEVRRFAADWERRQSGPVIGRLRAEADRVRAEVVGPLLAKLGDRLTPAEREYLEGAFRLFQNRLLHGPVAALGEAGRDEHPGSLREAVTRLFRLGG